MYKYTLLVLVFSLAVTIGLWLFPTSWRPWLPHRPYRAALGIEAALEEIKKNKGILYDNVVADACLRLFREKGYQLLA